MQTHIDGRKVGDDGNGETLCGMDIKIYWRTMEPRTTPLKLTRVKDEATCANCRGNFDQAVTA